MTWKTERLLFNCNIALITVASDQENQHPLKKEETDRSEWLIASPERTVLCVVKRREGETIFNQGWLKNGYKAMCNTYNNELSIAKVSLWGRHIKVQRKSFQI